MRGTYTGRLGAAANTQAVYPTRVAAGAIREVRDVGRAASATHELLRDRLVAIVFVTIGVDLACAVLALLFERHAAGSQVKSLGSALFWTSTQLLTVSSSLQNPLTASGRILDVAMEAYGITVVATLAASLGTFMLRRAEERKGDGHAS
jgi:hypothetical protein